MVSSKGTIMTFHTYFRGCVEKVAAMKKESLSKVCRDGGPADWEPFSFLRNQALLGLSRIPLYWKHAVILFAHHRKPWFVGRS